MQQATPWRPRGRTGWQTVLVRWLLVLAVILTLEPSVGRTALIIQTQQEAGSDDAEADTPPAADLTAPEIDDAQMQGSSDRVDASAVASDDAPSAAVDEVPSAEQPAGPANVDPVVTEADQTTDPDTAPAMLSETNPETEPLPGQRTARPAPRPAVAAESCPAELGSAKSAAFKPDDRLVMAYYYYWYDQDSLSNPALTQHPPAEPVLDWRSVGWHERQLADMASAGVDVALAVYWGDTDAWSVDGLKPMVEARERLLTAGLRPPAIGLFFDTNLYAMLIPDHPEVADWTTDDGQAMLAYQVGLFLDQVPPCHRARIDNRVLAFFWRADTEDGDRFVFDDRTFSGLNDQIDWRYGERLHYALETSWIDSAERLGVEVGAADIYSWGAALNGPRFKGRTVAIGPGYDDRRIDGRPGYLRERIDGATYSRDLRAGVMSGATWLLLETWNELWEGTAIAETAEAGRTYLGITARYTSLFHQLGAERARDGWFDLGSGENAYLRRLADAPVEQGAPAAEAGRWGARPFREEDDGTGYFHFAIDKRLGLLEAQPLTVWVEYFDGQDGSFALEYDSLDTSAPGDGVYKITEDVPFLGTGRWLTHRFDLPDASLRARQYDSGGDFRIHDRPGSDGQLHTFGRVLVTAAPGRRPIPLQPESLSFVEPTPRQPVTLRWTETEGAAGYLVSIEALAATEPDLSMHGYTGEERRRCAGEAELEIGRTSRGLTQRAVCELRLPTGLEEGIYRWQVQPLDASGLPHAEPSDWGYLVVARR
jgi:hypothetical protein